MKNWKKVIMSLSDIKVATNTNPVMAFPPEGYYKYTKGGHIIIKKPYICNHDDGFLCEHRCKWIINFIETEVLTEHK